MSKLDEVKEILNTLRVAMSLSFGMLIIVVSGIIRRFDDNSVDPNILARCVVCDIFIDDHFPVDNQNISENKRDKGVIDMEMGLLAIIGIAVLTAALMLFAVYKLSEE